MRVSEKDLRWAVSKGIVSAEQVDELWRALESQGSGRTRLDLPHFAYYFGALVVISAMTWFMTLGWEGFGGAGVLTISLSYAALLAFAGGFMWKCKELEVPGGLLVAAAVCMTPLVVYGFQKTVGIWPQEYPGEYRDFYAWIRGGWFYMEVAIVAVGLVTLRFVRFPFLMAPVAVALWLMSMDVTPLIYGEQYIEAQGFQTVSLVFGIVMLLGSFLLDRRADKDYAFWGYLFGLMAFWGGLSLFEGGGEIRMVLLRSRERGPYTAFCSPASKSFRHVWFSGRILVRRVSGVGYI